MSTVLRAVMTAGREAFGLLVGYVVAVSGASVDPVVAEVLGLPRIGIDDDFFECWLGACNAATMPA